MFDNAEGYSDWAPYLTSLGGGMNMGAALATGRSQGAFARGNAAVAGLQAQSEGQKGAEMAALYQQHLDATLGRQRAQVGAGNVTTSGSALRSLETTAELGAQDVARIQTNAARTAWGFQVNEMGALARSRFGQSGGQFGALGSLITSGSRAYGQWDNPTGPSVQV